MLFPYICEWLINRLRVMLFFIIFSWGGRVLERGQSEIRYQYDKTVKVLSAILVTWENMQPLGAAPLVTEVTYYGFTVYTCLINNYYDVRVTLWWCYCKSSWFECHYFSHCRVRIHSKQQCSSLIKEHSLTSSTVISDGLKELRLVRDRFRDLPYPFQAGFNRGNGKTHYALPTSGTGNIMYLEEYGKWRDCLEITLDGSENEIIDSYQEIHHRDHM